MDAQSVTLLRGNSGTDATGREGSPLNLGGYTNPLTLNFYIALLPKGLVLITSEGFYLRLYSEMALPSRSLLLPQNLNQLFRIGG